VDTGVCAKCNTSYWCAYISYTKEQTDKESCYLCAGLPQALLKKKNIIKEITFVVNPETLSTMAGRVDQ